MLNIRLFRFDVPLDCSVELSPDGYSFLTEIFEKFDRVCVSFMCLITQN